jgi:uncharacterized membrane protein YoaK (UPF0700 family)
VIKIKDMLKFIIPAVIFFLIVLFWEKINEKIYQKFKVKINLVILIAALIFVSAVLILLYF